MEDLRFVMQRDRFAAEEGEPPTTQTRARVPVVTNMYTPEPEPEPELDTSQRSIFTSGGSRAVLALHANATKVVTSWWTVSEQVKTAACRV